MRIANNTASSLGCNNLKINNNNKNNAVEKLTSGIRINKAADDAAGIAISEKMRSQINAINQASVNSQDGISLAQAMEGATVQIHSMIHRIQGLATQSASGTYGDDDRALIDKEVQQLKSEINRISTETEFNGQNILDGSNADISIQVGENQGFIIDFKSMKSFDCSSLGIDNINVSTQEDAKEALEKLGDTIQEISKRRVEIGSIQNRIEHSIKSIDNAGENITASESRIRDADMAHESMENIKSDILINSTESLMVQSNHNPEYVLKLING